MLFIPAIAFRRHRIRVRVTVIVIVKVRVRQTDGRRTDGQTSFNSIVRGVGLWRRNAQSE